MNKPDISPDFTVADIHKIREYHYTITKNMPFYERTSFYNSSIDELNQLLTKRKGRQYSLGSVEMPQEAFTAVLKLDEQKETTPCENL